MFSLFTIDPRTYLNVLTCIFKDDAAAKFLLVEKLGTEFWDMKRSQRTMFWSTSWKMSISWVCFSIFHNQCLLSVCNSLVCKGIEVRFNFIHPTSGFTCFTNSHPSLRSNNDNSSKDDIESSCSGVHIKWTQLYSFQFYAAKSMALLARRAPFQTNVSSGVASESRTRKRLEAAANLTSYWAYFAYKMLFVSIRWMLFIIYITYISSWNTPLIFLFDL